MAAGWIKMRPGLLSSPKVNGMARSLEQNPQACRALSVGCNGVMSDIVTRNVTRYVVVTGLLLVWGAANEHTSNGVFNNADLSDIDDIAGIPGFGVAMEQAGWLIFDETELSITLPNFNEYNTSGKGRGAAAKTNAERQKEYRERQKQLKNRNENVTTNNATSNVTSNPRLDKTREDIYKEKTNKKENATDTVSVDSPCVVSEFSDFAESPPQPAEPPQPDNPVSAAGAIATYCRSQGIDGNPGPRLKQLVEQGAEMAHFVEAIPIAKDAGKGFSYLLGIVKNMLTEPSRARASPAKPEKFDPVAYVNRNRVRNHDVIDI